MVQNYHGSLNSAIWCPVVFDPEIHQRERMLDGINEGIELRIIVRRISSLFEELISLFFVRSHHTAEIDIWP